MTRLWARIIRQIIKIFSAHTSYIFTSVMEYMPTYTLAKKPKQNLMNPPPYCRKTDRRASDSDSSPPPIKLEVSDPARLLALVESLKDISTKPLEKKINKYLQRETESQLSFLVSLGTEQAIVQVIGTKVLKNIRIFNIDKIVVENTCTQCAAVKFMTIGELDPSIQDVLRNTVDDKPGDVISVPMLTKNHPSKVLILACFFNPAKDVPFIIKLVNETSRFSLSMLLNTCTSEEEAKTKRECQMLLDVARKLFTHLGMLSELLKEIMSEAKNLTNAERCSLFLLDDDRDFLVAQVFDGNTLERTKDVRISKTKGIAGHVATTGKILNIKNAYTHPLFYKGLDEITGFKTRNILCFPIKDEEGIVGVAELCNKREGDFTAEDEGAAMAFSVYCGLSIMHTLVYKKTREAQIKTQLSNELMMYHMKVNDYAIRRLLTCKNPHNINIDALDFSTRDLPLGETTCYVLKMFEKLNLIETFTINREALAKFILYMEKGYRDTPYHNWWHALGVAHFSYLVIKNFELIEKEIITPLEAMALLTSCLGHDVDHRGTTNAFQMKTGTNLANLYSSEGSVMERHHLAQTLCILNTEKCNFLDCLDNKSYKKVLDMLKDNILATDLANHVKNLKRQQQMVEDGFRKESKEHRKLFFSLIMTCADLSDQSKGWKTAREVAQLVYKEFFLQGDMEKTTGLEPIEMMDREKASIPDLQIDFLNFICIPAYKVLASLFPPAQQFVDTMLHSAKCWEAAKAIFVAHGMGGKSSFEVLSTIEIEMSDMVKSEQGSVSTKAEEEHEEHPEEP